MIVHLTQFESNAPKTATTESLDDMLPFSRDMILQQNPTFLVTLHGFPKDFQTLLFWWQEI